MVMGCGLSSRAPMWPHQEDDGCLGNLHPQIGLCPVSTHRDWNGENGELVRGRNKRGLVQLFIHLSCIFLERVSQHLFVRNASYKKNHTHTSNFKVKVPFLET